MIRVFVIIAALCFAVTCAYAAEGMPANATVESTPVAPVVAPVVDMPTVTAPAAPVIETMVLKGDIIDNACAGSQQPPALVVFLKKHTKKCALKCSASGYAIFANGVLLKFDNESNAKVEEFLKKTDSKLQVVVEAKETINGLSLVSIKNQK